MASDTDSKREHRDLSWSEILLLDRMSETPFICVYLSFKKKGGFVFLKALLGPFFNLVTTRVRGMTLVASFAEDVRVSTY